MPLKHNEIWRAVDRLAELNGLSASGLAKKAGLSPTVFNPSKRSSNKRKRWPSTESIAHILHATGSSLEDFVGLTSADGSPARSRLPLLSFIQAGREASFDPKGHPHGGAWEDIALPKMTDPDAFVLEINGKTFEPVFREGDRVVVSPAEKLKRHDRVLLRTKRGDLTIRQIGRESGNKTEFLSLNPAFPPLTLAPRDISWIYRIVWVSQ